MAQEDIIKAEYIITSKTLDELARARYALLHPGWRKWLTLFCGGLLCLVSMHALFFRWPGIQDTDAKQISLTFILLQVTVALVLLLHKPLTLLVQSRSLRKSSELGSLATFIISDECISGSRFCLPEGMSWAFFEKAAIYGNGIILMESGEVCHWLPRSAFGKAGAWERAVAIVASRSKCAKRA